MRVVAASAFRDVVLQHLSEYMHARTLTQTELRAVLSRCTDNSAAGVTIIAALEF